MSCVLCLESSSDSTASVNIISTDGQEPDIRFILKKHFSWLKVDAIYHADSCICRQCWRALFTFHNFYEQVERAHTFLERDLKPTENFVLAKQLSLAEAAPMDEEDTEAAIGQIKIEPETIYSEIVKSERRQSRPLPQDPKVVELYAPTVIEENLDLVGVLQAEKLSEAKGEPDETVENNLEFISETDDSKKQLVHILRGDHNLGAYVLKKGDPMSLKESSKRHHMYSKNMLTTRQCDEYIAKNFKLSCNICGFEMDDFSALKHHFRAEHESYGYAFCCGKKLQKRSDLVDHLYTHQDPAYFSCPFCKKVLTSRRCLNMHLDGHKKSKVGKYGCDSCGKKFVLRTTYTRHLQMHKPRKKPKLFCPECGKNFVTQCILKQHLRLAHLKTTPRRIDPEDMGKHGNIEKRSVSKLVIKCKMCGISLASTFSLKRHIRKIHLAESQQVCPICSKISPGVRAHKQHMKQHTETYTNEEVYSYSHCSRGKSLADSEAMGRQTKKEPVRKPVIKCKICGLSLASTFTLKRHIRKIHLAESQQVCPICSKVSPGVRAHKEHMKQHSETNTSEDIYTYSHCSRGKTLSSPEAMGCQMEKHSMSKPVIICKMCGISLASTFSLKRHIRKIHLEESQQVCPICSKVSPGVRAHKQHMKQHTETHTYTYSHCNRSKSLADPVSMGRKTEKRFVTKPVIKCKICGLSLASTFTLKRHIRKIHLEESQQVCPLCSKVSPGVRAHKQHMKQHTVAHTDKKP